MKSDLIVRWLLAMIAIYERLVIDFESISMRHGRNVSVWEHCCSVDRCWWWNAPGPIVHRHRTISIISSANAFTNLRVKLYNWIYALWLFSVVSTNVCIELSLHLIAIDPLLLLCARAVDYIRDFSHTPFDANESFLWVGNDKRATTENTQKIKKNGT